MIEDLGSVCMQHILLGVVLSTFHVGYALADAIREDGQSRYMYTATSSSPRVSPHGLPAHSTREFGLRHNGDIGPPATNFLPVSAGARVYRRDTHSRLSGSTPGEKSGRSPAATLPVHKGVASNSELCVQLKRTQRVGDQHLEQYALGLTYQF